ncbi:MAG: hypothetical protein GOU97_00900 [Nanoarchaeota archaeon]|nr:hypothetical protein [Nanoarchaeota archaeon]
MVLILALLMIGVAFLLGLSPLEQVKEGGEELGKSGSSTIANIAGCVGKGTFCDVSQGIKCCRGFYCSESVCTCKTSGQECGGEEPCCQGLNCVEGFCAQLS